MLGGINTQINVLFNIMKEKWLNNFVMLVQVKLINNINRPLREKSL